MLGIVTKRVSPISYPLFEYLAKVENRDCREHLLSDSIETKVVVRHTVRVPLSPDFYEGTD